MTGVMTTVIMTCPRMCDHDHHYMEKEERPTTTGERIGQREGTTTTTMTRMTAMTTSPQDKLEEGKPKKRSDYVV